MRLLREPRFAMLFAGSALNEIGSWATLIALWGFSAYRYHTGAGGIALLGMAWTVPPAVLGLVSGWPIDRVGPKAVLMGADVLGAATSLAMVFAPDYAHLLILALAAGCVRAFAEPAAMALPPRLVDDSQLLAANAVLGLPSQLAIVVGPLVASLVIAWRGVPAAFEVDAATFVAGLAAVIPLRVRPLAGSGAGTSPMAEMAEGLRLVRHTPVVRRAYLLSFAVYCSWGAWLVIEPLYVRDTLHRSAATLGYLQTSFGIGLFGMTLLLPVFGERIVNLRTLGASVAVGGLAAALYVGTRSLAVSVSAVFVWGLATALFMPPMKTVVQRATPAAAHGRVMASAIAVNGLGNLAAIPAVGLVVGALGVATTGAVAGSALVACGLLGLRSARAASEESVQGGGDGREGGILGAGVGRGVDVGHMA